MTHGKRRRMPNTSVTGLLERQGSPWKPPLPDMPLPHFNPTHAFNQVICRAEGEGCHYKAWRRMIARAQAETAPVPTKSLGQSCDNPRFCNTLVCHKLYRIHGFSKVPLSIALDATSLLHPKDNS